MARVARVVAPAIPHHITQRGNRRQKTFFCADDYRSYIHLMAEWCGRCEVEVWAYCLMPNHIHMIARPDSEDGLRRAIGEAHRRYTRQINFREGWRGHLWQGRFSSFPLDETYLLAAARYVELNPVRAQLAGKAEDYPWSSAAAHLAGQDDQLAKVSPLLEIVGDWRLFLLGESEDKMTKKIRYHEHTGRPLGGKEFIDKLEKALNRSLHRQKPGPKKKGDK